MNRRGNNKPTLTSAGGGHRPLHSLIFLSVLYVTFSLFSFMLAQEVQLIHTCHLKKVCQVSRHNHGGVKETPAEL